MIKGQIYSELSHYVEIDDAICNGCVLCMKACPTKAIRVIKEKAHIQQDACIDCGECIRVCPRGAVKAVTTGRDESKIKRYNILSVSPVMYAQFGEDVRPNEVLLALRKVFKYVYDEAQIHELFNVATELFVSERRSDPDGKWPLISPVCPVVNRLIAYRFPSLIENILPILTPREIAARELKKRLYNETGFPVEEFGMYQVTPCSAKLIFSKEPMLVETSYLDGALGIDMLYEMVKKNLGQVDANVMLHHSSGVGIGWGMSGGEIAGLENGNYLAVSGIHETIRYLEKIEMGLLEDIEYVEFRTCPEGCLGGPMTVTDKYQAKYTLQKLVRMFDVEKRPKYARVQRAFMEGWFFRSEDWVMPEIQPPRRSITEAIRRQEQVEKIFQLLPEKQCGACGSPDCRTFAEDVVDGKATLDMCIYQSGIKGPVGMKYES